MPISRKWFVQRFLKHVPDCALGIGTAVVQRHRVQFVHCKFRAAQNETHLGAIAMCEDNIPALGNHFGDMAHGFFGGIKLIFNRLFFFAFDQSIAAYCDNSDFVCHSLYFPWLVVY